MTPSSSTSARGSTMLRPWWLLLSALIGGSLAGYLLWVAWRQHGLPVGCGAEAGCAEVLQSRWSVVWGMPVSALALGLYLGIVWAGLCPLTGRTARFLQFAAALLVWAAVWFVGLQLLVLRAICPWCLAEHLVGLVTAGFAWQHAARRGGLDRTRWPWGLALGSIGLLAAVQAASAPPATTTRLPVVPAEFVLADDNRVSLGDPPQRAARIELLQGALQVDARDEPRLGADAAPHTLFVMFDYCCPHCRQTHDYLLEALAEFPAQLQVVCLPTPRDADCNPAIVETEPRFEHACELAELALAVWRVDPRQFAPFDRWLFESRQPRNPVEALAEARRRVDGQQLTAVLAERHLSERIARNVAAFNASQANYLPVLMAPGMATVVGRHESREALFQVLRQELFSMKR